MNTEAQRKATKAHREKLIAQGFRGKHFFLSSYALGVLARLSAGHPDSRGRPSEAKVIEAALAVLDLQSKRLPDEPASHRLVEVPKAAKVEPIKAKPATVPTPVKSLSRGVANPKKGK